MVDEILRSFSWPPDEGLRQQVVQLPDEAIPALLQVIDDDKVDGAIAITILGMMGYPRNATALPTLVFYLGANPNDPRYLEVLEVLFQLEVDVVVLHLIRALLEKNAPYETSDAEKMTVWAQGVEGICWTIAINGISSSKKPGIAQEYARRCCPAINYLLIDADPALEAYVHLLLAMIERAGETVSYTIPVVLRVMKRHQGKEVELQAQKVLKMFRKEDLDMYKLL